MLADFLLSAPDETRGLTLNSTLFLFLPVPSSGSVYVSRNSQNCQVEFPQTCCRGGEWAERKTIAISCISGSFQRLFLLSTDEMLASALTQLKTKNDWKLGKRTEEKISVERPIQLTPTCVFLRLLTG